MQHEIWFTVLVCGALLGSLVAVLVYNAWTPNASSRQMLCPNCGWSGEPEQFTPGSLGVGCLLLFLFILPGLIYGIWQHSAKYYGCPVCSNKNIIPADSPVARALLQKLKPQDPGPKP